MKRDYSAWVLIIIALALGMPVTPAHPKTMVLGMCGGGTRTITLALDPSNPSDEQKVRNAAITPLRHVGVDVVCLAAPNHL